MHTSRGELRTAHELSKQLLRLALSTHEPALLLYARYSLGVTSYSVGEFLRAREHLEMAISLYDPERAFPFGGGNAGVAGLSLVAWTLWQLGYPDQALKRGNEALALAQGLSHPFSLALAELSVVVLRQYRREARAAQVASRALCRVSGIPMRRRDSPPPAKGIRYRHIAP
jgi:tetratricopeptide (TPR) repeat protein